MRSSHKSFAQDLVFELKKLDPRAESLIIKGFSDRAVLGIHDDGQFVPLLALAAPTPTFCKMMLYAYHCNKWQCTCHKDTPEDLAQLLAGPLSHLWIIPLSMADISYDPNSI